LNNHSNEIELIINLGKYDYMKELVEKGLLYLNTLEFYRKLENDDERRDLNEGAVKVCNLQGGVLYIKDSETDEFKTVAQLTKSTIRELNSNIQNLNVYCLYYLKSQMPIKNISALISSQVKLGFGDHAVIILDAPEFVTRIKRAAIKKGYKHYRGLVKYVDLSAEEVEVGPFVKDQSFSHQSELRVAVYTGINDGNAIKLKLGSLQDIAIIMPTNSLDALSILEDFDDTTHEKNRR